VLPVQTGSKDQLGTRVRRVIRVIVDNLVKLVERDSKESLVPLVLKVSLAR